MIKKWQRTIKITSENTKQWVFWNPGAEAGAAVRAAEAAAAVLTAKAPRHPAKRGGAHAAAVVGCCACALLAACAELVAQLGGLALLPLQLRAPRVRWQGEEYSHSEAPVAKAPQRG